MIIKTLPNFQNYGNYSSNNYGVNSLVFTDADGNEFYYSYETIVAFRHKGGKLYCCENVWSNTTGKHLNWIQPNKSERLSYENFKSKFKWCFGVEYKSAR
jgi:hypothetical protein